MGHVARVAGRLLQPAANNVGFVSGLLLGPLPRVFRLAQCVDEDDAIAFFYLLSDDMLVHETADLFFVGAVINVHVMGGDRQGLLFIGIKDDDVGVRPYGNGAFLREESKHLCGRG